MAVAACPKPEALSAFARGALDANELAGVAEHVAGCEACCRALGLLAEDSLAGLARAAAVAPSTVHSGVTPHAAGAKGPPDKPPATRVPAGFVDHPRYRIVGELGAGGMGTVYKAEDTWMARTIALKVVSPHLTEKPSALARFRKEVRAAAQLAHHNIVRAYDTGEADGAQFLVMEFVEGVSLDQLVAKKGSLPVPMACMFTRQAALGLQHAAEKGMVHRDIKPQNLLVTRKGQVKILDFGLARFARTEEGDGADAPTMKIPFGAGKPPSNAGVTNPNLLMGTPDYLSPEQAKNSHDVDPRSDIYSLGCTLYFLLANKPPFGGATTLIDKLLAHTHEEPPAIRLERLEVTEGLAGVLAKMMAKDPDDRYQSAAEVAAALLPFTRSDAANPDAAKEPGFEIVEAVAVTPAPRTVPAPVVAPAQQFAFDTAPVPDGPTVAELVKPKKKKAKKRPSWWARRKWAALGGVAALVVLIAGVVAASKKRPAETPIDSNSDAAVTANSKTSTPPPPAKGDKGDKAARGEKGEKADTRTPPLAITPPKAGGVKILYVLPSRGVWRGDYEPVRARLAEKGATVVTAAVSGDRAHMHHESPGEPIPIDVRFAPGMNLSDYSAVVFTGADTSEFLFNAGGQAGGAATAREVIQKMQGADKPVAAICVGQSVLAHHGALRGKRAAHARFLFDRFPPHQFPAMTGDKSGVTWEKPGVVTDGNVITASGELEAVKFADAIMKAIAEK